MAWEPENFTREQRRAAAKTVVHAQVLLARLDRSEFGEESAELVNRVYLRLDDMLSMLYEALYPLDAVGLHMPPRS